MKKIGRPLKREVVMEHLILNMTIRAKRSARLLEGRSVSALGQEILCDLKAIEKEALLTQSLNGGLKTVNEVLEEGVLN